jgi:hypothetical protein
VTVLRHFREDAATVRAFEERKAASDPAGAARIVVARGYLLARSDVAFPFTAQLASLVPSMRGAFEEMHRTALAGERTALTLIDTAPRVLEQRAQDSATARAAERAAWVETRAAELEAEDAARRRAAFVATAEVEALSRFDAPDPEPPAAAAARPRSRKGVDDHTTKAGNIQ